MKIKKFVKLKQLIIFLSDGGMPGGGPAGYKN